MNMKHFIFAITLGTVVVGCSKSEEQKAKPQTDNAAAEKATTGAAAGGASELFASRCTPCHGTSGKGDGPAAAALNPKPRDYTNKEWQASITDEQLKKVIVAGGAAVGKSPAMPPNPDLEGKPELDGLVSVVRSFAK